MIKEKCIINLFGRNSYFFILNNLQAFDAIVGLDFLRQIGANIDLENAKIHFDKGSESLKFMKCQNVNHINLKESEIPERIKNEFIQIINKHSKVFTDTNESLPYNTQIVATIRTKTNDPIYSKPYPYPMGVSEFVNSEIKQLLENIIIRPSRSPYNSPIWVVDKKGVDELGNRKKPVVIDFQKLNSVTIDDTYTITDISVVLSNLGYSKFFTTFYLKSGLHQIKLNENDRENSAFSVNNGKYEF